MNQVWSLIAQAWNGVYECFEQINTSTGVFYIAFGVFIAYAVHRFLINPFLKSRAMGSDGVKRTRNKSNDNEG